MSAPGTPASRAPAGLRPGEVRHGDDPVEINPGRPVLTLRVRNLGDRPVQVGSHYHFTAANPALEFDRNAAWGHRLAVPAGTAVRFEPGVEREVELVPLAGRRIVPGLRTESAGPLDPAAPDSAKPSGTGPNRAGTAGTGTEAGTALGTDQ
ncbi:MULTISPECIES: urease subunit beta [unclassified Frankia]|uniref:urease subunit beta n=1 Tax=unclassified Frankia TaxID=2632575 RepID=UPI001EF6F0EB|nr:MULTISPECIES: urease subunit beta [unclassified Frankia]